MTTTSAPAFDTIRPRLDAAIQGSDIGAIAHRVKDVLQDVLRCNGLVLPASFRTARPDTYARRAAAGGIAKNPQGPEASWDPAEPGERKRVHRGGSYLCTDQYCTRFRVGTRGKGEVMTGANHLGFRTVKSAG